MLWKIGIAHRDISISNLMCTRRNGTLTGVLNDYDLAIVMKPGTRHPESDGYERAGTTPFMAVDLLEYREEKLTRWYRHDLESFAWCLAWEMMHSPPRAWSVGSLDDIFTSKWSFLSTIGDQTMPDVKDEWLPFFMILFTWFESFRTAFKKFDRFIAYSYLASRVLRTKSEKIALRDAEDERKEDKEHVQFIVDTARESGNEDCIHLSMIQDVSWIYIELLHT